MSEIRSSAREPWVSRGASEERLAGSARYSVLALQLLSIVLVAFLALQIQRFLASDAESPADIVPAGAAGALSSVPPAALEPKGSAVESEGSAQAEKSPGDGAASAAADGTAAKTPPAADAAKGGSKDAKAAATKKAPPPVPERYRRLAEISVFGKPPKKKAGKPPSLLGVLGEGAILLFPDKKQHFVDVGKTVQKVRLVRVATNRALIEFEGKEIELKLFGGAGSESLINAKTKEASK